MTKLLVGKEFGKNMWGETSDNQTIIMVNNTNLANLAGRSLSSAWKITVAVLAQIVIIPAILTFIHAV